MSTIAKLLVGLGLSAEEFHDGMDKAEKKAQTSAAGIGQALLKGAGKLAATGLAAGVTMVTGAVTGSVTALNNWAGTLDSMGDVLGTSADDSAALAVAIQGVGGNVEAITSQMTFMTRGLMDAEGKLGPVGQTLDKLGVSFLDAQGKMLPTTDILTAVADKFATMPDGLEKTALMTEVFGKSGKDLGDTLNALANGGLAAASEKAESLGLMIGDEMAASMVESGKQVETLKMAAQGLFVTLGSELMPVLQPMLADFTNWAVSVMPQVRDGIAQVSTWITGTFIPGLQNLLITLQPVVDFLIANWQPIFAAVVAFILGFVIPALNIWATTAIATATTTITALAPVVLPVLAIAAAVGLLFAAWQNDWGGIRTTLTEIWEGSLKPALTSLWDWLQVQVPAAIAKLTDFWNNTLMPALRRVWTFVQDYLVPLFEAVAELFNVALSLAITALQGLWENVLLPALTKVSDYISKTMQPVFEKLAKFWKETLGPALETVKTNVLDKLSGVFSGIRDSITWVIDKISEFTEKLKVIKLPDWLTPGSPTPFENGLRGIASAMTDLNRGALADFRNQVQVTQPSLAPQTAAQPSQVTHQYFLTGNYSYESEETLSQQVRKLELMHA